jgi:hypothetical protein
MPIIIVIIDVFFTNGVVRPSISISACLDV